jgi:hypothetical protein
VDGEADSESEKEGVGGRVTLDANKPLFNCRVGRSATFVREDRERERERETERERERER